MQPVIITHRVFFFFNETATTEIYTLSLHDALPISRASSSCVLSRATDMVRVWSLKEIDRKSTRLNSSHAYISYAVFCLNKKIIEVLDGLWFMGVFIGLYSFITLTAG